MGTIISTAVAALVGGAMATATVIGVVNAQTSAPAQSPVDVTSGESVVQYGASE